MTVWRSKTQVRLAFRFSDRRILSRLPQLVEHDLGSLNNDEAAKLRAIFSQQAGGTKQTTFRGNAEQEDSDFRGQTPMLDRMLKGQNNQNNFRGRAQRTGPWQCSVHFWGQSINGGEGDVTNTYKVLFLATGSKNWAGNLRDGTPVPTGNVKMNEAGHVWWQDNLSQSFKALLVRLCRRGLCLAVRQFALARRYWDREAIVGQVHLKPKVFLLLQKNSSSARMPSLLLFGMSSLRADALVEPILQTSSTARKCWIAFVQLG